jgi:hypothetical protein
VVTPQAKGALQMRLTAVSDKFIFLVMVVAPIV